MEPAEGLALAGAVTATAATVMFFTRATNRLEPEPVTAPSPAPFTTG
jgi:hypothetical protein